MEIKELNYNNAIKSKGNSLAIMRLELSQLKESLDNTEVKSTIDGSVVYIKRIEEGESIEECIKREVREETGLEIITMNVIGISSNPKVESVEYPNGDKIQYFTIEFYSNQWKGNLNINDEAEIKSVQFMNSENIEKLPPNELSTFISLSYFRETQSILLK